MTKRTPRPLDPPTRFANLSDKMLADEMGGIDEELDCIKERQDEARLEMTRRGKWAIEGHLFTVVKAEGATSSFDTATVRKEMGETWYKVRCKPGKRTTYKAGRKGQVETSVAKPRARSSATAAAAGVAR